MKEKYQITSVMLCSIEIDLHFVFLMEMKENRWTLISFQDESRRRNQRRREYREINEKVLWILNLTPNTLLALQSSNFQENFYFSRILQKIFRNWKRETLSHFWNCFFLFLYRSIHFNCNFHKSSVNTNRKSVATLFSSPEMLSSVKFLKETTWNGNVFFSSHSPTFHLSDDKANVFLLLLGIEAVWLLLRNAIVKNQFLLLPERCQEKKQRKRFFRFVAASKFKICFIAEAFAFMAGRYFRTFPVAYF